MNYYIADCHFGHTAVLKFDHRPFADVQQMEESMVMLWNAAVQKGDTVYILGDFCWGKKDEWIRILRLLNGQKVLILGNHDLKQYPPELRREFADIKDYKEITDGDRHVILCHYPIPFYKRSNNPQYYMLCGHVHLTQEDEYLEKWTAELRASVTATPEGAHSNNQGQIINIGCMKPYMGYTPRTLDEIIRKAL